MTRARPRRCDGHHGFADLREKEFCFRLTRSAARFSFSALMAHHRSRLNTMVSRMAAHSASRIAFGNSAAGLTPRPVRTSTISHEV